MSQLPQPKKNTLTKDIEESFYVDTTEDKNLLQEKAFNWDDLNKLKDEISQAVITFMLEVQKVLSREDIVKLLKEEDQVKLAKLVQLFYNDLNLFSEKIQEARSQHEHKSGPIEDMKDFDLYNRLAIQYHALFSELNSLVTPTIAEMITILFTVEEELKTATGEA